MIRRTAVMLALTLLAAPLHAEFREVAQALETQLGPSTWIPFFGVARAFIRVTHPEGVCDVQLAVFEGKGRMDGKVAEEMLAASVGRGFTPLVKSRSKHEWAYIYARPAGDHMELVILSSDSDDTVLVRVVADPEAVSRIQRDARHGRHVRFAFKD